MARATEPNADGDLQIDLFCAETTTTTNTSVGSYYDPTLFGIMGGLALMFVVMCVVLQLFAK